MGLILAAVLALPAMLLASLAQAEPFIYALPAKDSNLFYRYDISANNWTRMANIPAKVQWGGALTTDGTYVYALPAKDSQLFYRYDISANTWTARANIPAKVKEGGALTYDGTNVFALSAKDSQLFYRYDNSANTWTARANIPSKVSKTGALTRLGSSIYGLPAKDSKDFYRYDIGANTWSARANLPAKVKEGGALTNDGTYVYALSADDSKHFYRYDIGANTWSARADLPAKVTKGGALTYDGAYIYALRAGDSQSFYRFDIASNKWSTRTNIPAKVKEGGALVFVPAGSSVTLTPNNVGQGVPGQERIYSHTLTVSNLTSVFNLSATSNRGWTVTIYQDVNGNGIKDAGDTPITATPSIGPNASYKLLVGVQVPLAVSPSLVDVTTVTATGGGKTASATDQTTATAVGQGISVQPNYTRNVVPGMVSFYGHTVTNFSTQVQEVTVTGTSSLGWTVLLWEDTNKNGVHETNNPNEPALSNPISLQPGETYWLVAEIRTPGNAPIGTEEDPTVDQTVIRADGQGGLFGTATDTSTVTLNDPPVIDGKYDDVYSTSPDSNEVCYADSTGKYFGKLATYYVAGSDAVYVVLAIDKGFVDNTYGTNAVGWGSKGHTFGNLTGSDHALFYGFNAGGTKVLDFKLDYITANPSGKTTPSGYSTLGVLGGEGRMNLGSAASIQEWGTSIDYSLNDLGYCTGGNCSGGGTNLLINSPATDQFYTPNPTYPDWIFDVIYEVKIDANAFSGGFGRMEIPYIHASPSKIGTNTIIPYPIPCPGEIGDYVWHDANRDQVQDASEQGIDNVQVQLYLDDGDGQFEPGGGVHSDTLQGTKTTTAGGKYLFQDLPAGDYWVYVVESTVPAGYVTTTYNSPMLVNLSEGESFLDADFGYATPSTLDYGDAPDTGSGTGTGNYNTVSTDNGPSHTIVNTLKLGNVGPDGDSGFLQNVDATADDLTNVDDEDGVSVLPQILVASTSVNLTVRAGNTAATPAALACWIDFNRNGLFENNFERASTTVSTGTADYTLTFSGLSGLVAGNSYLRCRIAYNSGEVANATGAAASGEVEDYKVIIGPQPDYGDAPDASDGAGPGNYQTRAADGGPNHVIVNNLRLGAVAPDGDNGTLQNVAADADDLTNVDDEDGVTTLPVISNTSTSVPLAVSAFNNTGASATVACWIDFNRNGVFGDTGERQSATVASSTVQQTVNLTFTGFAAPVAGDSYLRCRIASTAAEVATAIGAANSGEVEDYKITILGLDYGDAPDTGPGTGQGNYNTTATDNGPRHLIVSGLNLGSIAPDADSGTLQDVDATADDVTNVADEDGVTTLPAISVVSTSVSLMVDAINTTGASATVACWIDFNRNGVFENAEGASATIPSQGLQAIGLTFSGFGTPVAGDSYLRCRIANNPAEVATAIGAAASGEVEDYKLVITLQGLDYGDAPDTGPGTGTDNYNTTFSDNGPRHLIVSGLLLGQVAPDTDDGTLQNVGATADNETDDNDEDGVRTLPVITPTTTQVNLTVSAANDTAAAAYVVCWIDFNRDGDFLDNGEKSSMATIPADTGGNDYEVNFSGFAAPAVGASYLRCRIANSQAEVQNPTGQAQSGEVEDYQVDIVTQALDLGDAPITNTSYPTMLAQNGARHTATGPMLGTARDTETDGQPNALANGDDINGVPDDEDGVTFPLKLIVGDTPPFTVNVSNASTGAKLDAWIDWNRDGDWSDAGEQVATNEPVSNGLNTLNVFVPVTASIGDTYARFRLSTAGNLSVTGAASDGEVEDYLVAIAERENLTLDYGDAPDGSNGTAPGNYRTRDADNGPSHVITNGLQLGTAPTDDDDGTLQNVTATADDISGTTPDDEDGLATLPTITTISTNVSMVVTATNTTNQDGNLVCYIDFNRDGDFTDAGEQSRFTVRVPASSGTVNYTVNFTGFAPPTAGQSYLRCRVAQEASEVQSSVGPADSGEVEDHAVTIGGAILGAIGNRVWLDENGDGIQDAGEAGIGGVTVKLLDQLGNLIASTVTDTHGGYLFPNLPLGDYQIQVDTTTLPVDNNNNPMVQTKNPVRPNADFGNQTQTGGTGGNAYPVTIAAGQEENLTADFGYNWRPDSEVVGNTGRAAIGDRIWYDANGDGIQDPGEPGVAGVSVTLTGAGADGIFGNSDDPAPVPMLTDGDGNYLFNNLPAGVYRVTVNPSNFQAGGPLAGGYTQTGDPDQFGQPATSPDNTTTTPILLAPGDVFVNADFGYKPPLAKKNSIGDKIWFDADADGVGPDENGLPPGNDNSEPGIPGVTVALIRDTNGNGVWNVGEPIIATTITDDNGDYLFTGVPDGHYLVWVNDTDSVLRGKTPTYDANGGTPLSASSAPIGVASNTVLGLSASAVDPTGANASPVNDLTQDFGYTAVGQTAGQGLIGDTIFLDRDQNGWPDPGEGIEGVTVELRNSTGVSLLATTVTDENGWYSFGGRPFGTYQVWVKTSTLPPGLTNTVDPDTPSPGNSRSTVIINTSNPINLLQDFGYQPTGGADNPAGSIGDLIWEDRDADGVYEPNGGDKVPGTIDDEPGIDDVTVDLYEDVNNNGQVDPGDRLLGNTVTAGGGLYLFDNLPTTLTGVNYLVKVTDEAGLLGGWWHSLGTSGLNDNSQEDPYAVALTAAQPDNLTADFGYYVDPAALGNRVWKDDNGDIQLDPTDRNGIQDPGEPGLGSFQVTLTITYPNATVVKVVTTTATDGFYSFGNLLLDENFNGLQPGPEPTYVITVAKPTDYEASPVNAPGSTVKDDSNNYAGATALTVQGETDVTMYPNNPNAERLVASYDFGFYPKSTAVELVYFKSLVTRAGGLNVFYVEWMTANESDTVGFEVYRWDSRSLSYRFVGQVIPATGPGSVYRLQDVTGASLWRNTYLLRELTSRGYDDQVFENIPVERTRR